VGTGVEEFKCSKLFSRMASDETDRNVKSMKEVEDAGKKHHMREVKSQPNK